MRPVAFLFVGLVLLTTASVATSSHEVVGLPWVAAFVLGTVLSPTDPVAGTAISDRFGMPCRLVTILEGESPINDGMALVWYRLTVGAVVAGTFSLFPGVTGYSFSPSA